MSNMFTVYQAECRVSSRVKVLLVLVPMTNSGLKGEAAAKKACRDQWGVDPFKVTQFELVSPLGVEVRV